MLYIRMHLYVYVFIHVSKEPEISTNHYFRFQTVQNRKKNTDIEKDSQTGTS